MRSGTCVEHVAIPSRGPSKRDGTPIRPVASARCRAGSNASPLPWASSRSRSWRSSSWARATEAASPRRRRCRSRTPRSCPRRRLPRPARRPDGEATGKTQDGDSAAARALSGSAPGAGAPTTDKLGHLYAADAKRHRLARQLSAPLVRGHRRRHRRGAAGLPRAPAAAHRLADEDDDGAASSSEAGDPKHEVLVTPWATRVEPNKDGLIAGHRYPRRTLLYSALLGSNNDAAEALGVDLGGTRGRLLRRHEPARRGARADGDALRERVGAGGSQATPRRRSTRPCCCARRSRTRPSRGTVKTWRIRIPWEAPTGAKIYENHNKMLRTYAGTYGGKTGWTTTRQGLPGRRRGAQRPARDRRRARRERHLVRTCRCSSTQALVRPARERRVGRDRPPARPGIIPTVADEPDLPPDLQPEHLLRAYASGWFPMDDGLDADGPGALVRPRPAGDPAARRHPHRRARCGASCGRAGSSCASTRRAPRSSAPAPGRATPTTACGSRERFQRAYRQLHELGYVHSLEAWRDERLVGGLYGVALGRAFMAESMFHREPDAGSVALVARRVAPAAARLRALRRAVLVRRTSRASASSSCRGCTTAGCWRARCGRRTATRAVAARLGLVQAQHAAAAARASTSAIRPPTAQKPTKPSSGPQPSAAAAPARATNWSLSAVRRAALGRRRDVGEHARGGDEARAPAEARAGRRTA